MMSRLCTQDLLAVLRGCQNVTNATTKLREVQLKQVWVNSNLKILKEEIGDKIQKDCAGTFTQTEVQVKLAKTLQETIQRTSMVVEGVQVYVKYAGGLSLPRKSSISPEIEVNEPDLSSGETLQLQNAEQVDKSSSTVQDDSSLKSIKTNTLYTQPAQEHLQESTPIEDSYVVNGLENSVEKEEPPLQEINVQPWVKERPSLSESAKQRKVPSTRLGRMMSFGGLIAGLGMGTVAEVSRRSLGLKESHPNVGSTLDSAFLSDANAERIVNTLCKVRGAALKIGQILSIQDNTIISPKLQKAFERVRQSADFMPEWQVEKVLNTELGYDWGKNVISFEPKPFAAASVGQVHMVVLTDNREAAMKIQYPGVARSIVSDIDNLVGIMKVWNIFPEGFFIDNLVEVAKRELAWEVDYEREAECTKKFKELLSPYPEYSVPGVIDLLSTRQVFTTEYLEGIPVDKCVELDVNTRRHICKLVMQLCLRELFEFRFMQTDPNWANFLYNPDTKKLVLLDFGASRSYEKDFMDLYIQVIKSAAEGDREKVLLLSRDMGFLTGYETKVMEEAHVDTVMILGEVFRSSSKPFNFGAQDTTRRVQRLVPTMVKHRLCPPPEEIYSLHRKLSGVFLLCAKLNVQVECRSLFDEVYEIYTRKSA